MTDLLHDVRIQKIIRIHATVETKKKPYISIIAMLYFKFCLELKHRFLSVYEISPILRHFHSVATFFFVDFITRIS